MDSYTLKLSIKNRLMNLPVHKESGHQVNVRCPYCGDSKKQDSAHFAILINLKDNKVPMLFQCWKCAESGILNPSVMRSLMINDLQLNSGLITYNSKTMGIKSKSLGIIDNNFNLDIPKPNENLISNIKKKEYIEGRLGLQFTFDELVDLKTVFSLGQFLRHNDIQRVTKKKEDAILLDSDYVGFLTTRNEFITFRDVYGTNRRHDKYNIYGSLDNTRKFYTIPNEIDLLTTKKITINIAEGVMDILGIYHHVFDKERKNMIYTAVCGSGFVNVLKYFIKMGVIDNVDINIFSDENHNKWFYKNMIEELSPWVDKFTLFYNTKHDDYGVTKDQISLRKEKLDFRRGA